MLRRLVMTCVLAWIASTPAAAQSPVITSAPSVIAAGSDFATDVLANPWDFNDAVDVSPFPDELAGWTISASTARTQGRVAFLSGVQFVGRTATGGGSLVPLLFRGGANFITSSHENSGVFDHKAIPTASYGKLAVAMTLSASTAGQLAAFWYSGPYGAEQAQGVAFKTPQAGTHLYIVDLASGVWLDARGNSATPASLPVGGFSPILWNGTSLMRGLQLRPTSDGNASVDVSIDWVRLTQRDGLAGVGALPISFSGCAGRDYNVEVLIGSTWEIIHIGTAGSGTTTANVNHGVLPPGSWSFRVTCYPTNRTPSGGTGISSPAATVTINSPPMLTVHNPDSIGGADFATSVLGNPWDFNALSDIVLLQGSTNASIVSDGVTNALQATGTSTGDPAVVLLNGAAQIDTARFRNLTFALTLDTPFGLNGGAGQGSVARVFWERPGAISISQDILVWPGRNLYTIDLAPLTTSNGGLETECVPACQQAPWSSGAARHFRIDPHESALGVTYRMGSVLLTAPDEVALGTEFAIQFSFTDVDAGSYQARIYLDSDRNAADKTLMGTMAAAPSAVQTFLLNPAGSGVPAGEYFVFIEIVESRAGITETRGLYASGPLRVGTGGGGGTTAPGAPSLTAVQTANNPVTVAWAPGPGGTPTSYTVAAGTSPGASNLAAANMGTATQVSANAPVGIPIYVRVIAANAAGSAVSNEASFIVGSVASPPGPPTMNPPAVSGRTVSLSWNPPATGGAPAVYVLVARRPGSSALLGSFQIFGTGVTVPSVPPGDYVVTVAAANAAGLGPESGGVVVSVR